MRRKALLDCQNHLAYLPAQLPTAEIYLPISVTAWLRAVKGFIWNEQPLPIIPHRFVVIIRLKFKNIVRGPLGWTSLPGEIIQPSTLICKLGTHRIHAFHWHDWRVRASISSRQTSLIFRLLSWELPSTYSKVQSVLCLSILWILPISFCDNSK